MRRCPSFPLRLPRGQRLGHPDLDFGPPFVHRAIEEIIPHVQPAFFVLFQLVDVAVFEDAFGKRHVLCAVELAAVKAG